MKTPAVLSVAALVSSAAAYFDLNFYTGVECAGNELWRFRVDANNRNKCHDVAERGYHAAAYLVTPHNGESKDTYLVFYNEPNCEGDWLIRARDECIRFDAEIDTRSFQYIYFDEQSEVWEALGVAEEE